MTRSNNAVAPRPVLADPKRGPASARLHPLMQALRTIVTDAGAMPSERAMAKQLNVKRHQLRRALEALRENGEIAPARAGRPAARDPRRGEDLVRGTNPLEIIELRAVLEPALARLAALRASPFEISRIERAATTPEGSDPGAADLAFHVAVAAGARNNLAAEVHALLRQVARDGRVRLSDSDGGTTCPNRIRQRDTEHAAVAASIAARDPEGAERAMRDHLAVVQWQILTRLAGTTAG